jgi:uncharacterized circularly permuted ATP-grasp superfamily protein
LIEPADWRAIATGIAQRARLLDAMLADCYGPQRLLHEGLLPPALVQGHPGYLRALHGVEPPGGLRLHVAAFDLARGPEGGWWVMSQRTQAPSGLGYVLENRLIVSRQFPEAFRELRVEHLASGYRRTARHPADAGRAHRRAGPSRSGRADAAPGAADPGPYNETYFEHAYLARYLGLPLVEGGDLAVRGERLYLKTVQGLEPLHGLLRRLDDDWCDPLELKPDSALGVPGLLQVMRAGQLVVANALGAGFLESPGIQGFLPAIARRLLSEELAMPSLPTWWCGEASAWEATRDELDARVVRPTYPGVPGRNFEPLIGAMLPGAVRDHWRARIDADPDAHTLQRYLPPSQTPWWEGGQLLPRTTVLRVYAITDPHGRWHVLPGGMARIATRDPHLVSMQHGGASCDTWVLAESAPDTWSMLPQRLRPEEIAEHRRPVSSRTAENLFWMGRYTERTENLVRLAQATAALVEDDDDSPDAVLEAMSALARRGGLAPWGAPSLARSPRVFERAVAAALLDPGQPSIAYNLAALERAAGALREPPVARARRHGAHDGRGLPRPGGRAGGGRGPAARHRRRRAGSGAGAPGASAGRHHRRAERPHDARRRLAAADRRPAGRAPDRHGRHAARVLRERGGAHHARLRPAAGPVSTAPSPTAPATLAARRRWRCSTCWCRTRPTRARSAARRAGCATRSPSCRPPPGRWTRCWRCCRASAPAPRWSSCAARPPPSPPRRRTSSWSTTFA